VDGKMYRGDLDGRRYRVCMYGSMYRVDVEGESVPGWMGMDEWMYGAYMNGKDGRIYSIYG
jgi:hypothetical protein